MGCGGAHIELARNNVGDKAGPILTEKVYPHSKTANRQPDGGDCTLNLFGDKSLLFSRWQQNPP